MSVNAKGKGKVHEGRRIPHVVGQVDGDDDSSGLEHSLDEELGIPSLKTQV